MLKKIGLVMLGGVSLFAMNNAEININDKDLELDARFDLGQFNETVEVETTFVNFSYIQGNEDHSDFKTKNYFDLNFLMKREVQDTGVKFGIGVKANYMKVNYKSFITIPLGIELGYKLPTNIPAIIGAKIYYAPESLAYSKAESFLEYRADISVEVIKRGSIVVGYRNIDTNIQDTEGSQRYNASGYFGFRFDF